MATKDESYLIERMNNGVIDVTVEFPGGGGIHLRGLFESEAKALAWIRFCQASRHRLFSADGDLL